jgi:hypothetical protein
MDEHDRDVVAPARRMTRRRQLVLAGSAVVVLVLVGIGGMNVLRNDPGGPPPSADVVAPGVSVPYAAPDATQVRVGPQTPYMAVPPGTNPPERPPTVPAAVAPDPGTGDCADRQDPALRALVEQALPEVVGAPEAAVAVQCRPGGERRVALQVEGGVLTIAYLPPGWALTVEDARTAPTASGGTVVVLSRASRTSAPAPFADRLDGVVTYLAPRL